MRHIICVGAVYMDTILTVPHFPEEDKKIRASNHIRRRGGNTANTLEVISQLLPDHNLHPEDLAYSTDLSLLTVLSDPTSQDTKEVIRSLPEVSSRLFRYRHGHEHGASSYIIQNTEKQTRTIVSANPLQEMTVDEFTNAISPLITPDLRKDKDQVWIHFEGRIPEVLLECVKWLRDNYGYHGVVKVSVECEKPDRTGMKDVAALADVVFYSKEWAEASVDPSICAPPVTPSSYLRSQVPHTQPHATLICTWSSEGAEALAKVNGEASTSASEPGWRPPPSYLGLGPVAPVDTVGAGDTFIAGMLYALVKQKDNWGLAQRVAFANELAGRKVFRQGYGGLGEEMKESGLWGEQLGRAPRRWQDQHMQGQQQQG